MNGNNNNSNTNNQRETQSSNPPSLGPSQGFTWKASSLSSPLETAIIRQEDEGESGHCWLMFMIPDHDATSMDLEFPASWLLLLDQIGQSVHHQKQDSRFELNDRSTC